jgi:hypothetical protein
MYVSTGMGNQISASFFTRQRSAESSTPIDIPEQESDIWLHIQYKNHDLKTVM